MRDTANKCLAAKESHLLDASRELSNRARLPGQEAYRNTGHCQERWRLLSLHALHSPPKCVLSQATADQPHRNSRSSQSRCHRRLQEAQQRSGKRIGWICSRRMRRTILLSLSFTPCTGVCMGACTLDFCNGPACHTVMKADMRIVVKYCRRKSTQRRKGARKQGFRLLGTFPAG